MPSINITLFSGISQPPFSVSVPIFNQTILTQRTMEIAKRHKTDLRCFQEQCSVNCRELFQEKKIRELFFFPASHGKSCSLEEMSLGPVFFIEGRPGCGFIFCFSPDRHIKNFPHKKYFSFFLEKKGYPAGAAVASHFFFSPSHLSILISEHGEIVTNNCGELVLKGIEVAFLQKKAFGMKSLFVQRKNECVSPNRSLSVKRYNKYIKVRCICPNSEFSYSTQFPVLSPEELIKEINCDKETRLLKYGAESHLTKNSLLIFHFFDPLSLEHVIFLPRGMGIDVPFGACQGGNLFFSYRDENASKCLQLVFFPQLFEKDINPKSNIQFAVRSRFGKTVNRSNHNCGTTKVSIFHSSTVKLVQCSSSEYKLDGARVVMTSTKKNGGWAACFSREAINLTSSPVPGSSGIGLREATASLSQEEATVAVSPESESPQTQQEGRSSLLPGPSGIGCREATATLSQEEATVAVSPENKSPQTQQEGRNSPLPGPSGIGYREATASLSQAEATVAFPTESETPQTQQEGRSSPLSEPSGIRQVIRPIPFRPQVASIASVSTERQSQQTSDTQQRRNSPVPGLSGVRYHPYSQYGPWSFSEGSHPYFYPGIGSFVGDFYPYGSPFPPCPYQFARQDQWMPVFPSSASVVALEPFRYNISVQEGVGHSGRAEEASASVSVGVVQQTPIWRPDEESSSAEVSPKAQSENPDEDTDIDVEN